MAGAAEKGGIQGVGADSGSSRVVVVGESMFVSLDFQSMQKVLS